MASSFGSQRRGVEHIEGQIRSQLRDLVSMEQSWCLEIGCDRVHRKLEALEEKICERHEVDSFPHLWLGLLDGAQRACFIVHDVLGCN